LTQCFIKARNSAYICAEAIFRCHGPTSVGVRGSL